MKKLGKKGISTVSGAVLFILLIFVLQTTLFLAIYRYNNSIQDAIKTEAERIQEKIILSSIITDSSTGVENVYALMVNNTGAITVRIRAIYIDNQFLCDPSSKSINPDDTYVNPKETSWILMPPGVQYNPTSKITVVTERGTKSTDYEWKLKQGGGGSPPVKFDKFYLGPLMLDFNKFYYAEVDPQTGVLKSEWRPGWRVEAGTGAIAWNITVKDIDDRDITLNQFSVFTLVPNDQPSNRRPWYMEPPPNSLTQHIKSNETVQIIYKWTTPKTNQTKTPNTQNIYTTVCRCRIFLTFFGIFHEPDGTTKPYGQTIPFEAVLVEKPNATITVTASPTVLAIKSTMTSTITAKVMIGTKPIVGANVTFTTTAGNLSSPWAITDATGTATVSLTALWWTSPANATVTATWITILGSTIVLLTVETIQVTASPTVIAADSVMKSTITANVTLGANPVVGANVTFTRDAGTLSSPWAITDANGIARVNLTSGMNPAIANVTAIWINTLGSTTVFFVVDTVQVTASPTVIVIKSTMNSTITALVMRNAIPVVGANVTFTTTAGNLSSPWAITDTNGIASVDLTALWWASPANATVTATWLTIYGSISDSTTVRFTVETIQVTASPTVIATNSTMNSTITAKVVVGANPIAGANVTFTTNASSLSSLWAITDVDGIARVYLNASMSPEIANVTAIWINTLNSTTVRFTNLYVTTDKTSYAQNDTVRISGLLRHVNGTPIQGVVVSINVTASNGTVIWSVNSTQTDSDGAFTYDLQLIDAIPDTYTIIATYQAYEEKYHKFTVT